MRSPAPGALSARTVSLSTRAMDAQLEIDQLMHVYVDIFLVYAGA